MRDTYPLTVASDRYSRLAIWAFDSPSPRQPSTSASRSVSVPTSLRACSRAGWLSVDAAIRRRAAAGDSTVCPSAATRTSPIRSVGGVDLTRNPAAPARRARSTYWSASKVVSTTTTGGSASLPICPIAVRPSTPGMRRSMSTRSGRLRTTACSPAAPSCASSTTSMSPEEPRIVRRCAQTIGSSSTTTTRIMPVSPSARRSGRKRAARPPAGTRRPASARPAACRGSARCADAGW